MKSQQFSALLDFTLGVKRYFTEPPYYKDRFEEEIQGFIKKIDDTKTKKEERTRTRTRSTGREERRREDRRREDRIRERKTRSVTIQNVGLTLIENNEQKNRRYGTLRRPTSSSFAL